MVSQRLDYKYIMHTPKSTECDFEHVCMVTELHESYQQVNHTSTRIANVKNPLACVNPSFQKTALGNRRGPGEGTRGEEGVDWDTHSRGFSVIKHYPLTTASQRSINERRQFSAQRGESLKHMFCRVHERRCTDLPCLVLYVLFLLGVVGIMLYGLQHGEPERLVYPTDYKGHLCGVGANVNKSVVVYPKMMQDILYALTAEPYKYNPLQGGDPTKIPFFGICLAACPRSGTSRSIVRY